MIIITKENNGSRPITKVKQRRWMSERLKIHGTESIRLEQDMGTKRT